MNIRFGLLVLLLSASGCATSNSPVMREAEIAALKGTSGHGDRDMLVEWLQSFENTPKRVFVNHGEDATCTGFAKLLHD